jgi:hypothetical protein
MPEGSDTISIVNPEIQGIRPNSPLHWGRAGNGMAWHHVIPYSLLRGVWNRLVGQHIATDLPEARVTIRQYLSLCDRGLQGIDEKLDKMRFEDEERRRAGHYRLEQLSTPEVNELQTAAVWPAWNIVGGPTGTSRRDDPEKLDLDIDRFMVGLRPPERDRMRTIEDLSTRLQAFVDSGPEPDGAALHTLSSDITLARRLSGNNLVGCDLPIPFRPEMWVQESGGLWRKRRPDE